VQQIVTNLLSNAFKFTAKGGVTLKLARAEKGWTPGHAVLEDSPEGAVAISVIDTGIGIPASKQRLIFEAFQQADGTTSREYGGTGLGLSISRELARLLGGEIRLQSAPGQGSTFTLYMPLRYQPVEPPRPLLEVPARRVVEEIARVIPAKGGNGAGNGLNGRKVLVVDDDIRNVFALTSALEAHGMRVLHAESGKEGIDLLKRSGDVDAVLMDVMMPGLDGIDTMRIVRQLDGYQNLPIIAVTAKAMIGDREKCIEAGATDYVAKPVNMDALLATLSKSVERIVEREL
jgi:CheY-like chemotaxis protein